MNFNPISIRDSSVNLRVGYSSIDGNAVEARVSSLRHVASDLQGLIADSASHVVRKKFAVLIINLKVD